MEEDNNKNMIPDFSPGNPWKEGSEEIGLDQLCAVRALNNKSQLKIIDKDGKKEIYLPTAIEITKGEETRTTSHWTLNHKVSLDIGDGWLGSSIIILSPLEVLVQENGDPENLKAVDTFWAKGVKLPKGSKILFLSGIPDQFKSGIEGIEIVDLELDKDLLEKVRKAREDLDNNYSRQTENEYYNLGREMDEVANSKINPQIESMGYTVLDQDHNGSYMGEENLDRAIVTLAEKRKIKSSVTHAESIYGEMDSGFFSGPLTILSEYDPEKDEADYFTSAMRMTEGTFRDMKITTKGEKDLLMIFSAELYKVLKKYPNVLEDIDNKIAFNDLMRGNSWLQETLRDWAEKDKSAEVTKMLDEIN